MKIVRQTTQASVRPTSGGGFLMCPKRTWLRGSFSDTLNPGFHLGQSLAQITGNSRGLSQAFLNPNGVSLFCFLACNFPMSMCPLLHLRFACVLYGVFASLTLPNSVYYLKSTLVIFLYYLKKKKSALSRWEEERVPSISQVVFDDSDFTLAQGYPVSTKQTRIEHQELTKR